MNTGTSSKRQVSDGNLDGYQKKKYGYFLVIRERLSDKLFLEDTLPK